MPTPDASQFTTKKKYAAIKTRTVPTVANRVSTFSYVALPKVAVLSDFLDTTTSKSLALRFVPASNALITTVAAKPKRPAQ